MAMMSGALIGLASAAVGGISSAYGASQANAGNRGNLEMQLDFAKSQSDSVHQREMADLRAAGLNPILTATGGSGNPVGPVPGAAPTQSVGGAAVEGATRSVASALEAAKVDPVVKNVEADTVKKKMETSLSAALADKADAERANLNADRDRISAEATMRGIDAQVTSTAFGTAMKYLEKIPGLSTALDLLLRRSPAQPGPGPRSGGRGLSHWKR